MDKLCHCCGSEYIPMRASAEKMIDGKEIDFTTRVLIAEKTKYFKVVEDLEDSYVCKNHACRHIYRHFYKDISEFHSGEYRESHYDENEGMLSLKNEPVRLKRAINQLTIVSDFVKQQDNVLEVAPGRGFVLKAMTSKGFNNVLGVDIDDKVTQHNKKYNPDVKCITKNILDLESGNYDVVMGFDLLEHIEELDVFVDKMHFLTNKYVVLQVPVDRPLVPPNYHLLENPLEHQGPFDGHLHYFTELSIINLLTNNNMFKCVFMYKTLPGETAGGPELLCVFEKTV
jgi:hypothetical protein